MIYGEEAIGWGWCGLSASTAWDYSRWCRSEWVMPKESVKKRQLWLVVCCHLWVLSRGIEASMSQSTHAVKACVLCWLLSYVCQCLVTAESVPHINIQTVPVRWSLEMLPLNHSSSAVLQNAGSSRMITQKGCRVPSRPPRPSQASVQTHTPRDTAIIGRTIEKLVNGAAVPDVMIFVIWEQLLEVPSETQVLVRLIEELGVKIWKYLFVHGVPVFKTYICYRGVQHTAHRLKPACL